MNRRNFMQIVARVVAALTFPRPKEQPRGADEPRPHIVTTEGRVIVGNMYHAKQGEVIDGWKFYDAGVSFGHRPATVANCVFKARGHPDAATCCIQWSPDGSVV